MKNHPWDGGNNTVPIKLKIKTMPLQLKNEPPYYEEGNSAQYNLNITQSGTAHPTKNIFVNSNNTTLTTTRLGAGQYQLARTGGFTTGTFQAFMSDNFHQPVGGGKAIIFDGEDGTIKINTYVGDTLTDGLLFETPISITVFNN